MATSAPPPAPPASSSAASTPADDEEHLLLHAERSSIFETRVERAALCRDRGSALFRSKDLAGAVSWYERALFHVDFDEGTWHFEFLDKHRAAVNEVRLPVYLNLAACYLAAGPAQDLAKATENANLALEIDGGNTKALYRAGRAHLLLGDLDAAKSKLTKAAKNQPGDKNIREALQQLKDELSAHKAKEKQTWGGRLLADADADTNRSATEDAGTLTNEGDGGHSGAVHGSDGLRFWIMAAMAVVAAVVLAAMHLSA